MFDVNYYSNVIKKNLRLIGFQKLKFNYDFERKREREIDRERGRENRDTVENN